MEKLDLRKQIVLDLKKEVGLDGQIASVCAVFDKSGSMSPLYSNGFMQELVERLLPIGLGFDDDGTVDTYVFHDEAYRYGGITRNNYSGVVSDIIRKYEYGGTRYAPPIKLILDEWVGKPSGGLLGFGAKKRPAQTLKHPVFVLYFTDGENEDKQETIDILREASNYGVFFMFVGVGNASLNFLQKLDDLNGRFIDNADFHQFIDVRKVSDEELYRRLMVEFPKFVKDAKSKNLIA